MDSTAAQRPSEKEPQASGPLRKAGNWLCKCWRGVCRWCPSRRKPWEKSDIDHCQRRFITAARYALYILSLLLAVFLASACLLYLFDTGLWKSLREWTGNRDWLPAGCLYISYVIFFLTALMHFWGRYEKVQFMARVQDRGYVEHLVESGEDAQTYLSKKLSSKERNYAQGNCEEELRHEVSKERLPKMIGKLQGRLDDDKPIVEYDLLALKILLVDCSKSYTVPSQARAYLADLKNYADEEAHTQTVEEYSDIRHRIENIEKDIYAQRRHIVQEAASTDSGKERKAPNVSELREIVKEELLPQLTENEKLWSEGSAIVKSLRGACLAAIPLLLAAGLVPMYMGDLCRLWGIHWAILGVAGALVAVLRALGETKRLAVGNEQGVKEVQRAWWGAGLGLVAGLLTYMLVKSGFLASFLFGGPYLPDNLEDQHITVSGCFLEHIHQGQIYVHMLLAFLAGYAFERVIDRVRAAAAS